MRPRNEQCPRRKPGLWHRQDGDWVCAHCGTLLDREDPIAQLRALVVSGQTHEVAEPEPEASEPVTWVSSLTEVQWHRLVIERARFERHDPEWPDGPPPETSAPDHYVIGLGSL